MLKISIHAKNMLFLRPIMLKIEALMSKNDTFMLNNVELLYHDWTNISNVADCYS